MRKRIMSILNGTNDSIQSLDPFIKAFIGLIFIFMILEGNGVNLDRPMAFDFNNFTTTTFFAFILVSLLMVWGGYLFVMILPRFIILGANMLFVSYAMVIGETTWREVLANLKRDIIEAVIEEDTIE